MSGHFPALLRAWRERALLTQDQLAARTGLGVRTIRRLEAGRVHRPRSGSVRLLADALGLTSEEREQLAAAAAQEAPAPAPAATPRQLSAGVAGFAGRTQQLRRLAGLLADARDQPTAVVISAITGTAGVGKTALALQFAHRAVDTFPDGQLYVNLRGFDPGGTPCEPAAAVRGFLDALGVPPPRIPADLDAQSALYRSLLAGRRVLVVLDNARDAEQVRPLLPGTAGSLALVTSRDQLTGLVATDGAVPLAVDLLSTGEARDLLAHRLGADRVGAEPAAVEEIISRCARLPLALAVAAARAATQPELPLASLAAELREAAGGLDAFDTGDAAADVRAVLGWSYQRIGADAARLFRLLALHPGPDVSVPAAASLAAVPPRRVRPLLAELVRAHLLTEHPAGRYAYHDLLRAYATELVLATDSAAERQAARQRMLSHYVQTSHAADRLLDPDRPPFSVPPPHAGTTPERLTDYRHALLWFDTERPVLLAVLGQAGDTASYRLVWLLARTMTLYLDRRSHWRDLLAVHTASIEAARRLADRSLQAVAHVDLGLVYGRLGQLQDAYRAAGHALLLFRQLDDSGGQARVHSLLTWILEQQDRLPAALHEAERAYELFQTAGHRAGQANALNSIGHCHARLGRGQQALHFSRRALAIFAELDHRFGQAHAWDTLGRAHRHLGQHEQAVACLESAIAQFHDLGDRHGAATTLTQLGDTHNGAGDIRAAHTAWQQALDLLAALDHPDADGVRARLGEVG